ncbi:MULTISPECIES: hypothetical protein [Micromonosporaceae]|uniref:hypothetical protein n=1 Tax=Micromonosporaceae TaxID=28056 RepID=UPI0033D8EEA2
MTNDAVNDSASGTRHDVADESGRVSVDAIESELVRDFVDDLVSRIAHQTSQDSAGASQQRSHLRRLAILIAIQSAADDLANTAASDAAKHGANYPAIGEAAGMTRQAARVRWPGLVDRARMRKQQQESTTGDTSMRMARRDS